MQMQCAVQQEHSVAFIQYNIQYIIPLAYMRRLYTLYVQL